ncbi:hypothetical protein OsI_12371 [Oryza sativa Indica Group]|uniref:hAT-like transposase RNase-H fold domain-containing protein n=1 Tax=Oryza sativa subsp. indica TaxID=39946 RepID=B8AL59_ORYSI|nr:hypothetical protein OsI_12371 [Oryza sativa Indica Group]
MWFQDSSNSKWIRVPVQHRLKHTGTSYPTANLFYHNFREIKALITPWMTSDDVAIKTMATSMNKKVEKYWKRSNLTLVVAYFLEPRFKTKAVEYNMLRCMILIKGLDEVAETLVANLTLDEIDDMV